MFKFDKRFTCILCLPSIITAMRTYPQHTTHKISEIVLLDFFIAVKSPLCLFTICRVSISNRHNFEWSKYDKESSG